MAISNDLRFAVIGASRGKTFIQSAQALDGEGVRLTAVCDTNPEVLKEWADTPGVKLYSDYDQVLADPEIDAVCIATPIRMHASQSIAALNAGKHVLSEVTANHTLEEGYDLIDAVKRSGRTYMMAENYCYMEPILQVQQMVEQGVFGELVFASGAYIHDCRSLVFTPEGDLTWRGEGRRTARPGSSYPTHSMGPIARWLGINRTDRLKKMSVFTSPALASAHYARRHHPDRPEYGDPAHWSYPDTCITSIETEKGALISLRFDAVSCRPHQMARHELQGTKASFLWPDGPGHPPEPLIWIEDRSPTSDKGDYATEWEPLSKYREEFMHPLWREHGEAAKKAGHGGGDYFVLREFAAAVREGRSPLFDVVDAVTWSALAPLGIESVAQGNTPVCIPDFKVGRP